MTRTRGALSVSWFVVLLFLASISAAQTPGEIVEQKRCCNTATEAWYQEPTYYMSETACQALENGAWEDTEEAEVCRITPDPWPPTGAPTPTPYNCQGCQVKLAAPKPPDACFELVGMWVTCNLQYVPGVSWGTSTGTITIRSNTQVSNFGTKCDVVASFFWGMKPNWGRGQLPPSLVETLEQERQFYETHLKPQAKRLPNNGQIPQLRTNNRQNRKN